MTGVLAGALEARQIPSYPDKLRFRAEGIFENVDERNLLTSIRLNYQLKVPHGKRAEALRALEVHAQNCPASLSVQHGIRVGWSYVLEEE